LTTTKEAGTRLTTELFRGSDIWSALRIVLLQHNDLEAIEFHIGSRILTCALTQDEWHRIESAIRHSEKRFAVGRPSLSPRQIQVLSAIKQSIEVDGTPPSVRELATTLGGSASNANQHLKRLEAKGYIRLTGHAHGIILEEGI
jgi:DNA-binding CsgD family transcriptional regulator